ncbi:FHA domain-containing protein At4g14490-like [Vicia villosa]|uniref:FHA domain-containing protein At4g14490-like n=1 Tax=Vicia villosa TaxID=3911 RepID=UPI00273AF2FF|nr:FHA domain-containing protein At4g14490-like [Vicia villosa]
MEDAPSLELQILNGPRKGETHRFQPGFTVKIGRVVRGNNLPIKDPGISTKHLTIQIDSGNWVVLDLDSSNGTVLDGATVPPNTPFHLRDGSVVKIGEVTSIVVNFVKPQNNATVSTEVEGKPMRGKRGNKGVNSRVPVQSVDENETGNVVQPEPTRVTRNTRSVRSGNNVSDSAVGNLDAVEEKVEEPKKNTRATRNNKSKQKTVTFSGLSIGDLEAQEEKAEELKNARVTRNAKNKNKLNVVEISESSNVDLDVVEEKVEEPKNKRVTRNAKNKRKVIEISESSIVDLDVVEEKVEEPKKARVTRNAKNKQKVIEVSESSVGDLDVVEEKVEEPKNVRVTRNSKNKGIVIGENSSLADGVVDVEKKKTRGGAKGKKKLEEECVDDGDGKDICDEKDNENLNKDENWTDMNKMSLGEWFDFLEVFLPKQINNETEAIIDSMREKAERLREYVIMYQNQKA